MIGRPGRIAVGVARDMGETEASGMVNQNV
jgi:hypothetical protein